MLYSSECWALTSKDEIMILTFESFVGREYEVLEQLISGPLVALISGDAMKRFHHRLDVIQSSDCESYKTDHAIQIVGYDMTAKIPYYIVRNSWGTGFDWLIFLRKQAGMGSV
uniref:Peptidase C1A papain C-terminal domain-containing protein n=1 Tax=Megaselia scalaris TaxID=36166 RepID=T1GJN0_MEGSC